MAVALARSDFNYTHESLTERVVVTTMKLTDCFSSDEAALKRQRVGKGSSASKQQPVIDRHVRPVAVMVNNEAKPGTVAVP